MFGDDFFIQNSCKFDFTSWVENILKIILQRKFEPKMTFFFKPKIKRVKILCQKIYIFQGFERWPIIDQNLNIFQKFLARSDQTKSGDINLAEFIQYVSEHEKNLRLQFTDLDKNKDGKNKNYKRPFRLSGMKNKHLPFWLRKYLFNQRWSFLFKQPYILPCLNKNYWSKQNMRWR